MFYDPSCRGAEAYRAFAKEFVRRNPTRGGAVAPVAEEPPVAEEVAPAEAPVAEDSPVPAEAPAVNEAPAE